MKALVLTDASQFDVLDVPEPETGENDVLIDVRACGICGSDVHGMDGSSGRRQPPIIMGHEASGVIARTGSSVEDWRVGDRVTFDSTVSCGDCHFCRRGQINLCDNRMVLGVSCDDFRCDGAFAELVTVPQHILYRLPDDVSFAEGAMVEAVSIAVHGVARTPLSPDDTTVVIGTGIIGLLVVQSLRARGCGRIIGVDIDPDRRRMASEFGADDVLDPLTVDVATEVAAMTGGRGADVAIEVVGMTQTVQTAVSTIRKGGHLTLIGNLSPTVDFPLQAVVTRELSVNGSCASNGEYSECLDLMAAGKIDVKPLISATAPLEEGAAYFDRLYRREPGLIKIILKPGAGK